MKRLTKAIYGHSFVVASILALVFSVTYAVANDAIQSSSTKTLYACVTKKYKTLNLTTKSKPCPKGQRKISWNVTGRDGAQGLAGVAGAQGPAGVAGLPGMAGANGANGANGADGLDGATGPPGPMGPTGPQGSIGPPGSQGDIGPTGVAGPQGQPGDTGPTGPAGAQGPQGVVEVARLNGGVPMIAGSSTGWVPVGPATTITTNSTQQLVGSGAIALGRSAGTQNVSLDFCYRPASVPGQTPFNFSGANYVITQVGVQRVTLPMAGAVSPGAGSWIVSACVWNSSAGALDNNDYMNAWVMVVN